MLMSLVYIAYPYMWVYSIVAWITYLPSFIALVRMIAHTGLSDEVEYRRKLYKTFAIFGSLGLILMLFTNVYVNKSYLEDNQRDCRNM